MGGICSKSTSNPVRSRSQSPVRSRSQLPVISRSQSPVRSRSQSPVRPQSQLPDLPDELLREIFSYNTITERGITSSVTPVFNNVLSEGGNLRIAKQTYPNIVNGNEDNLDTDDKLMLAKKIYPEFSNINHRAFMHFYIIEQQGPSNPCQIELLTRHNDDLIVAELGVMNIPLNEKQLQRLIDRGIDQIKTSQGNNQRIFETLAWGRGDIIPENLKNQLKTHSNPTVRTIANEAFT